MRFEHGVQLSLHFRRFLRHRVGEVLRFADVVLQAVKLFATVFVKAKILPVPSPNDTARFGMGDVRYSNRVMPDQRALQWSIKEFCDTPVRVK